jgi:hypothetical protein
MNTKLHNVYIPPEGLILPPHPSFVSCFSYFVASLSFIRAHVCLPLSWHLPSSSERIINGSQVHLAKVTRKLSQLVSE